MRTQARECELQPAVSPQRVGGHKRISTGGVLSRSALALLIISFLFIDDAMASPRSWARHGVGASDITLSLPSQWKTAVDSDTTLRATESPARKYEANLAVHAFAALSSMADWRDHHRTNNLTTSYPGARTESEREIFAGAYSATLFHLVDLGGDRNAFALLEGLVPVKDRFVVISLLFDRERVDEYEPLFIKIVSSLGRGAIVPSALGGSEVESNEPDLVHRRGKITWQRDFDQAFEEARRRNVPVLIAFNHHKEDVCRGILKTHYSHRRIVNLSRGLVALIASVDDHVALEGSEGPDSGCPWFEGIECREHQAIELSAREGFLHSRSAVVPQHLLCSPQGEILSRREYMLPLQDLEEMMTDAILSVRRDDGMEDMDPILEPLTRFNGARLSEVRVGIVTDLVRTGRFEALDNLLQEVGKRSDEKKVVDVLTGMSLISYPQGVGSVAPFLNHRSATVRKAAAKVLEKASSPVALAPIRKRLSRESRPEVKIELVHALARCGQGEKQVASELLKMSLRGKTSVKVNAIVALHLFPRSEEVTKALLRTLERGRTQDLKAAAAWTLGYLEVGEAENKLKKMMKNGDKKRTALNTVFEAALARIQGGQGVLPDYMDQVRLFKAEPRD